MNKHILEKFSIFILVVSTFFLAQCSGKDKASELEITIFPEQPIVFPVGITRDTGLSDTDGNPIFEQIDGNWFKFKYSIINGTESCMVILSLAVNVYDMDGKLVGEGIIDPSQAGSGESATKPLAFLGYYTDSSKTTTVDCDGDSITEPAVKDFGSYFFMHSLPKNKDNEDSFFYRIEISPQGWFGTETDFQSRLVKTVSFSTQ